MSIPSQSCARMVIVVMACGAAFLFAGAGAVQVSGGLNRKADQKITVSADEARRAARSAQAQRKSPAAEPVVYGNIADLMSGEVPTFPTIVVDYRDDDATRMREAGLLSGPLPMTMHEGGVAGGGCSFDVDCDDGNRCTMDICNFPSGQPAGSGICENVPGDSNIGNPQCPGNFGLLCGGCDDGLYCNGVETCSGGVCVDGPDPCTGLQVCSESFDMCQNLACTGPDDCSNASVVGAELAAVAALKCNGTETCTAGVCIAGENPCGAGAICGEKQCSSGPAIDICLTDADCLTLGTCSLLGPVCLTGRCCTGSTEPACTRRAKQGICSGATPGTNSGAACMVNSDCDSNSCPAAGGSGVNNSCDGVGGIFYGHDAGSIASGGGLTCPIINDVQVKCPKYGSGIAPRGPFSALLGPISNSPIVVPPFGVPLQKLGDDYTLSNPGVCVLGARDGLGCGVPGDCPGGTCNLAGPSFIALDFLRFAGGSPATDRIAFEFYDESGNFVEDLFFSGTAAFGVYPVLFDPPIIIPAKGFVVQRVAPGFSPNARHVWASTDAVDIGSNDANRLWVNGGPVSSNFGTTGILSFELEGTKVAGNFGACCYTNPDVCQNAQLPWSCRGTGGAYLGNGTNCAACDVGLSTGQYCRRCSNDSAQSCNTDSECGGGTCIPTNSACDQSGPAALCVAEPSCNVGGCCNPTTGGCTVETESGCIGGGRNYLGNGTDCDADNGYDDGQQHCCPQPVSLYTGADNCENVILHIITAPPIGETRVITITGNNTPATNTFANPDSCWEPSENSNADPGWWEGFATLEECIIIYIDHCCTDPVHRPAYRVLYDSCPCGSALFTTGNPYIFGEPPDSRGLPYCAEDDNAWQCFGMLGPGQYYYPIYSALAGHHGDYQLHIVAKHCPTAACCLQDQCVDGVTQSQCDALGGEFLAPPQKSPAVSFCTGTNGQPGSTCFNGSCCTGPGECFDFFLGQPVDLADCNAQSGNFVGGVNCKGGECSGNSLISCSTNAECVDQGVGPTCVGGQQALAQPLPCPICENEIPGHCQSFDNTLNFTLSDRHLGEAGFLAADDVRPDGDTLSQICVWGFYLDGDPNAPANDCGPVVTSDHFRVRVYNNDPATGRSPLPGPPLATSMATSEKGILPNSLVPTRLNVEQYVFQLTLNTPITGLIPGAMYWIEVSNDVSDSLATCNWFWSQRAPDSSSLSFSGSEFGYYPSFEVPRENVFCTNFTFTPSTTGAQPGACCNCDSGCSLMTLFDCANGNSVWDITETSCAGVTCPLGTPPNDSCTTPATINPGSYIVDNQCATTDGYGPIDSDMVGSQLDYDMWYTFIAPAACDLVVSECQTGLRFDSMLAVYSNCTEGDPGGCDPTICPPCPYSAELSSTYLAGIGQDESCTGVAVGGPGIWIASEQILRPAVVGECFLLRIGSFPGGRGTANLDIQCATCRGCVPPAAVPQSNAACTAAGVPTFCCSGMGTGTCDKTRFISFTIPAFATAAAGESAIRIKLTSLHHVSPPYTGGVSIPFTAFEGQSVWVGPPITYISPINDPPWTASTTQCTPHYRDWSTVGLLHVTGSAIVPSSTYTVENLSASCMGSEDNCTAFLPGVTINTTRWGDVEQPYSPPSASIQPDVGDIGALVNKFRSAIGAPIKARALIAGSDAFGNITTLGVDLGFGHIAACIDAFRGAPYPYQMGKCATGTGACTTNSDCTGANAPPCNLYCP